MAVECPRCKIRFVGNSAPAIVHTEEYEIEISAYVCPECGQYIVYAAVPDYTQVYPPDHDWADFSKHVPSSLLADFEESRKVLDVSPNASAMLSRRCLQRLIEEHLGIRERNLETWRFNLCCG
jgi:hypothetical protein